MKLITDNSELLRFIPHSINPVPGETSLFDKIKVHLQAAEDWAASTFTSSDILDTPSILPAPLIDSLRQLVVAEALSRAIPALDLVVTPNGFGVVSTNTVAPASSQRVDRLIGSIREIRDSAIESALAILPQLEEWRSSSQARFFSATLFPNLDLPSLCGVNTNRWDKYCQLRSRAICIEDSLAEEFFSPELIAELRLLCLAGTLSAAQLHAVRIIRGQVVDTLMDLPINASRMRDLVNFIRLRPSTFPKWHLSATAALFSPPKFFNKKDSHGYWF